MWRLWRDLAKVDPIEALCAIEGVPAALDRNAAAIGGGEPLEEAVEVLEGEMGLFGIHSMAHDHVTPNEKGHSNLRGLSSSSAEDKLYGRIFSL
jgi:hypothetical protein